MIKDDNELKSVVEQIKATLGIEELDDLERQYNKMYKELKEKEMNKNKLTVEEVEAAYSRSIENQNPFDY